MKKLGDVIQFHVSPVSAQAPTSTCAYRWYKLYKFSSHGHKHHDVSLLDAPAPSKYERGKKNPDHKKKVSALCYY